MSDNKIWDETFVERRVTYHIEVDGQLILVEKVPARVNVETGERMFSPDTVEHLQEIVRKKQSPKRTIKTPVYEYA